MKISDVYKNRLASIDGTAFVPNGSSVPTVATARDIGNIGAGFMAGKTISIVSSGSVGTGIIASTTELPWIATRLGFDGYNFFSNSKIELDGSKLNTYFEIGEPPVSTKPQRIGFDVGKSQFKKENMIIYQGYKKLETKAIKWFEQ